MTTMQSPPTNVARGNANHGHNASHDNTAADYFSDNLALQQYLNGLADDLRKQQPTEQLTLTLNSDDDDPVNFTMDNAFRSDAETNTVFITTTNLITRGNKVHQFTNLWEINTSFHVIRSSYFDTEFAKPPSDQYTLAPIEPEQDGGSRMTRPRSAKKPAWLPTSRSVVHKGASRKLWRSAKDAAVTAVKRVVKAADGSRKARFERV